MRFVNVMFLFNFNVKYIIILRYSISNDLKFPVTAISVQNGDNA